MSYALFILPRAQRELASLPAQQLEIAESKIESLRENPRPTGARNWRIVEAGAFDSVITEFSIKSTIQSVPSPLLTLEIAAKFIADLNLPNLAFIFHLGG